MAITFQRIIFALILFVNLARAQSPGSQSLATPQEIVWAKSPAELLQVRFYWDSSRFTDPKLPLSTEFKFVIKVVSWKNSVEENVSSIQRLADIGMISASVVTDQYGGTFLTAKSGLILNTPKENIVKSHFVDYYFAGLGALERGIEIKSDLPGELARQGDGLHTPEELIRLALEAKSPWNEVRIQGKTETGDGTKKVQVSAIWYADPSLLANGKLKQIATELRIPLIHIPLKSFPQPNSP